MLFDTGHIDTESVKSAQPLCNHSTDNGVGSRKYFRPEKNWFKGGWKFQMPENLEFGGTHGAHQIHCIRIDTFITVQQTIAIGKRMVITTRAIFGAMPKPIQSTRTGAMAMVGIVWVMTISG